MSISGAISEFRTDTDIDKGENIASTRAMEKGGMVQYGTEENGDPLFRFTAKEKAGR